ncbi:MAG TPA: hypothetical protein VGF56_13630 [Rhizomicrobium sp.]|jgi:hypothetical protein
MADSDRDYRLLNASIAASSVKKDFVDKSTKFYERIQLVGEPRAFVSGERDINACFVGETGDNGLIIAFRGTLGSEDTGDKDAICLDWTQGRDYADEPWTVGSGPATQRPGNVARGFATALKSLWNEGGLGSYLTNLPIGRKSYIWITGHSKGGAMALLAATLTFPESLGKPHIVVTSGQPKVLKAGFRTDLGNRVDLGAITTRYQFQYDVVPDVPDFDIPPMSDTGCQALDSPFPAVQGFIHVGELVFNTYKFEDGYAVAPADGIVAAKIEAAANLARLSPYDASAVRGGAHNPRGDYLVAFKRP